MTDIVAELKMAFNEVNSAVNRAAAQNTSAMGAMKAKLDELSIANARASSDADIEAIIQQMHGLASSVNATTDAMVAVLPPLMAPSAPVDPVPASQVEAPVAEPLAVAGTPSATDPVEAPVVPDTPASDAPAAVDGNSVAVADAPAAQ